MKLSEDISNKEKRACIQHARKEFLQVGLEEFFHACCGGFFVSAFDGDGHGFTALDAQTHQSHQLGCVDSLTGLVDGDGAVIFLGLLDQKTGRAGMNADRIGDGVSELFNGIRSFSVKLCGMTKGVRRQSASDAA